MMVPLFDIDTSSTREFDDGRVSHANQAPRVEVRRPSPDQSESAAAEHASRARRTDLQRGAYKRALIPNSVAIIRRAKHSDQ